MDILIILGIVSILVLLWLNFLATLSARHDHDLDSFQRNAQYLAIWLLPFIGASLVLFFVFQHSPNAIPRAWIPWPFRTFIFGTPVEPNKNRGRASEHDSAASSYSEGAGDGGGD